MASRIEVQTTWSIDDVADANDALDAWHEAQRIADEAAQRKAKR